MACWTLLTDDFENDCREFHCKGGEYCIDTSHLLCNPLQRYCIHSSLRCNSVPNCGAFDHSDEDGCKTLKLLTFPSFNFQLSALFEPFELFQCFREVMKSVESIESNEIMFLLMIWWVKWCNDVLMQWCNTLIILLVKCKIRLKSCPNCQKINIIACIGIITTNCGFIKHECECHISRMYLESPWDTT